MNWVGTRIEFPGLPGSLLDLASQDSEGVGGQLPGAQRSVAHSVAHIAHSVAHIAHSVAHIAHSHANRYAFVDNRTVLPCA